MPVSSQQHSLDVIVLGLPETGKTAFIDTISHNGRTGQPHGWHSGEYDLDKTITLRLLEPPAAYVFDDNRMRELLSRAQAAGYIILCDSTMPDRFGRMTSILNILHDHHPTAPTIMAANKQDHPKAWTVEDIRLALDVPDRIPIVACAARDTHSVGQVIDQLRLGLNR